MKRRHDQAMLGRIKRKTVSVANEEANKIPHTCTQRGRSVGRSSLRDTYEAVQQSDAFIFENVTDVVTRKS